MNATTTDLTGTYYPTAPGARTWREARELRIDGKRVSVIVTGRDAVLFIGGGIAFDGELPATIAGPADLTTWARETAANAAAVVAAAEEIVESAGTAAATLSATATTADEHRAAAAAFTRAQHVSAERADEADGALSQWAHGINAAEHHRAAELAEAGNVAEFAALFDLDGNLVPAVHVDGKWGWSWKLLDARGRCAGWVSESKAKTEARRIAAHAAKGYYVGRVRVAAHVELAGGNIACVMPIVVRNDGGYSADAEIVDNGHQAPVYAAA
ncbi:hypothetical protein [Streptomyces sp. NPDC056683]|uniref:hypothetical protein n=1 Tax=Streptomyces sp. NPDC056683 TaxID=3345910 RepID=UPI0036CA8BE3